MSVDAIPFTVAPAFEELGAMLQVLSRKVELGFGQLVEAVYVVCRKRQVHGSEVPVKLLHCARSDDRRDHTGTALDQASETAATVLPNTFAIFCNSSKLGKS
jgi:hypothetical protein